MSQQLIPVAEEVKLRRRVCQLSFWRFVQDFWLEVPGAQPPHWNWHMKYIADELQDVAERVFKNETKKHDLLINVSPGTSKSSLVSILFPPWTWTRMPRARHISASHTDTLVLDLATKSRTVVKGELYQKLFPEIKLREDVTAKGYYANTLGGDRFSCTVGGVSPMGMHAHFLTLDDPTDPQKVLSQAELATAGRFAPDVLFTRKVDKNVSVFIGVMQRLRVGDPSDVLLQQARQEGSDPIRHICLPAELADNVSPPELKEKYVDGLMDPVRLSHKALRPFKNNPYTYAGQFMQSPYLLGGGMFKAEYFTNRVQAAPYQAKRVRAWDRASTAHSDNPGACYTAGVLMAKGPDGVFYVEDCVHGQWEPEERNRIVLATAMRDRARYGPSHEPSIYIEAEGGSSGKDAWLAVAKVLAGFPVYQQRVTGSKDTRAEPWSCMLAAGNVRVVDGGESKGLGVASWDVEGYVQEHLLFRPEPGKRLGRYKDRCLVAGTLVRTLRGDVPIENVVVGDEVLTREGFREVEWSGCTGWSDCLYEVTVEDGRRVTATVGHPVWTLDRGFIAIESVKVGQQVLTLDDSWECLESIKGVVLTVGLCHGSKEPVYNLKVKEVPEFFANGVLVHNCDASSMAFNVLTNTKQIQALQTHSLGRRKARTLQVMVVTRQEFESTVIDHDPALVVYLSDPSESTPVPPASLGNVARLLSSKAVQAANIDPEYHQEEWETPVEPYGKPCRDLILSREGGKSLWGFLVKRYDPSPGLVVLVDDDRERALSVAMGVVDALRIPRKEGIAMPGAGDNVLEGEPPNRHLYRQVKGTRGLVV